MTHKEYLELQTTKYKSFESTNERWAEGQRRYILEHFSGMPLDTWILDCACGDGVGLRVFAELGFECVHGVECDSEKAVMARESGYRVMNFDFHSLQPFGTVFDVVYSSHSLEHALEPDRVLKEFHRVLEPDGILFLVLPFPDTGTIEAHVAKEKLGTVVDDGGAKVVAYIESMGFELLNKQFDSFREPEIWLTFKKV
jgi:SAM-dependent methyltransferase